MSTQRGVLPTLTEVIEIDPAALPVRIGLEPLPPESMPMEMQAAASPAAAAPLQNETPIDVRVRELLAPELASLVERTLDSVRGELAVSVQALVRQAIDGALAERRRR